MDKELRADTYLDKLTVTPNLKGIKLYNITRYNGESVEILYTTLNEDDALQYFLKQICNNPNEEGQEVDIVVGNKGWQEEVLCVMDTDFGDNRYQLIESVIEEDITDLTGQDFGLDNPEIIKAEKNIAKDDKYPIWGNVTKVLEDDKEVKEYLMGIEEKGKDIKKALGITATVSDAITIRCPTCRDILLIYKNGEESCICGDWFVDEDDETKARFVPVSGRK